MHRTLFLDSCHPSSLLFKLNLLSTPEFLHIPEPQPAIPPPTFLSVLEMLVQMPLPLESLPSIPDRWGQFSPTPRALTALRTTFSAQRIPLWPSGAPCTVASKAYRGV